MNAAVAAATGRGRIWRSVAAAVVLSYGGSPLALGLGEAEVESALGQRLAVILPVHNAAGSGWPGRCGWRLADPTRRGGGMLDRPRLEAGERAGDPILTLSTAGSVREPVVEFTVELACGSGYRLARDYTILLDPPSYGPRSRPASMASEATRPPTPPPVPKAPRPPAAPPAPAVAGDRVTVNPGDTLSAIVERHYPGRGYGPALARAIVAANPRAFRDGDPDRLLAGARLSLPGGTPGADGAPGADDETPPEPPPEPPLLHILSAAEEGRLAGMRLSEDLDPGRVEAAVAAASQGPDDGAVGAAEEEPPPPQPVAAAVEPSATAGTAAGKVEAELAEARGRMAAMVSEMAALEARVQSLATALEEERVRPREPPWWLWLGGGAVLVLLLAMLLAWLARRREAEDEIPFPTDARPVMATPTGPPATASPPPAPEDSPPPAVEIPQAPPSVASATDDGREEPRSTEQTQEITLQLIELGTGPPANAVEAEFLNLVESESDSGSGEPESPGGISEEQSRQLNRSVTVRLLEVELHLLYEQYGDAAEVLRDLMDREPPDQPDMRPWSMAFSLYRQTADRQAYDDLEARFRARFNVRPPAWDEETPAAVDMETRYPHLVARIATLWDSPAGADFLNGLLLDDRQGERAGFEMAVAEDISFLRELLAVRQEGARTPPGGDGR